MTTAKRQDISVLVVDDELVVRQVLESNMRGEGYAVRSAKDGEVAWQLIEESQPDIVISDLKMPNMDGFELLKKIRDYYPRIGFIGMTGFGDSSSVKKAMLLGADEYISKPFKPVEVALVVERAYWNLMKRYGAVATGYCEDD